MKLSEMTWPEVAALDRERVLVVLPIAACEQHSHHLPTFTDTILCTGIAEQVEAHRRDDVLLLPTLWLGASDHHLPFGATLTLPVEQHALVLSEIIAPLADDGFKRFFILNGHGGNIDTYHVALRRLQATYPDGLLAGASYWEAAADELSALSMGPRKTMGHACEFETAMMLHFRPDLVRLEKCRDEESPAPDTLRGVFLAEDFSLTTERGAIGYPEAATAESGKAFVEAITARLLQVCDELRRRPLRRGRQSKNRP